jgi:GT2 family glycosyltransferase
MSRFFDRLFKDLSRPDADAVPDTPASRPASTARPRLHRPDLEVRASAPLADKDLPRCAIVILNLNGRHHLAPCFESIAQLDYPKERVETILIDNASSDGSVEEMRAQHGWVKLVVNERNVGFAAGCNQGAKLAKNAGVLVFLNNDMRVDPKFLRELVAPLVHGECQATTAKMFAWDGKLMNSAGGGMNFHGIGIQRGYLEPPGAEFDVPLKTLFACGGAMAMDAGVFHEVGGFDEEFFAYYEDVDLGWRTWVQGHTVQYVPTARCWHHHSSTSRRMPPETIRLLQTRNPVLACFKNYDDENLRALLGPILALHLRRMWMVSGLHEHDREFRIEDLSNPAGGGGLKRMLDKAERVLIKDDIGVRRTAAADLIGINDLLGRFDHWSARRAAVQAKRRRADAEIFGLFLKPNWCIEGERGYVELQRGMTSYLGLDRFLPADSLGDLKG